MEEWGQLGSSLSSPEKWEYLKSPEQVGICLEGSEQVVGVYLEGSEQVVRLHLEGSEQVVGVRLEGSEQISSVLTIFEQMGVSLEKWERLKSLEQVSVRLEGSDFLTRNEQMGVSPET